MLSRIHALVCSDANAGLNFSRVISSTSDKIYNFQIWT
jgi:hypothetical protein